MFMKNYFNRYRIANYCLLLIGLLIYLAADWYWGNVCADIGCTSYFKSAYLAPLREGGLVIAALATPFLFLPTHYFRTWAVWIFIPLLAWSIFRLSLIDPNSSNMFAQTREEITSGMLTPWLVVTFSFIAIHWYRTRSK